MNLPSGISVLQRGWLSSNNVLLTGGDGPTTLVDSGYVTHAPQTLALLQSALQGRPLELLVNTHLHSDHCGGNALLQASYAGLRTCIPPGHAQAVAQWDEDVLTFRPTGQQCARFGFDAVLVPGSLLRMGGRDWQVLAAPGHDPHSVILFEPASATLISADALWERGFGIVFPELDGDDAFAEVGATLDLIAQLRPQLVIPGHGAPFADVDAALATARQRLDGFVAQPRRHLHYAAKVLLKFKLLEWQRAPMAALHQWAAQTPYVQRLLERHFDGAPAEQGLPRLLQDLVQAGAARIDGDWVCDA